MGKLPFFQKETTFVASCLLPCETNYQNSGLLLKKRVCSYGSKFPLKDNANDIVGKNENDKSCIP